MFFAERNFEQPAGVEKGGNDDSDHYSNMEKGAKRTAQFIKQNKTFYCSSCQKVTRPKECAFRCKECRESSSQCSGCSTGRTAYGILLTDKEKESSNSSFVQDIKRIAQEEINKDNNVEQQETKIAESKSLDLAAFRGFNPSSANQCWRPAIPCVSLTKKNLYINTEAVRKFGLHDYNYITLLFNCDNNTMLLDFTEDHPRYMRLTLTHRKSGDAKVSFIGFRKNFGLETSGKFRSTLHSEGRIIVDLNDRVGA